METIFNRCDCIIIKGFSNLLYFSKFNNNDATIILSKAKKYYLTDARYLYEAHEVLSSQDFEIIDNNKDEIEAIKGIITDNNFINIGLEDEIITYAFYKKLSKACDKNKFFDITSEITKLRSIKEKQELEYIRRAQEITDKTFLDILPHIKEGITEVKLGHILYNLLLENGAESMAFESIIAFGENSAKPHALKGDTKLRNKQWIKMDFGAKYKGYCADMTRTVAFGKVEQREIEIYKIVAQAQEEALNNMRADISCKQAYDYANDYFMRYNVQDNFLHSLGHGLGLDIHEMPTLSRYSKETLRENMVVSVEPGLYFADEFGVRIEDIVIIKKNGIENLTKSPKKLIIL